MKKHILLTIVITCVFALIGSLQFQSRNSYANTGSDPLSADSSIITSIDIKAQEIRSQIENDQLELVRDFFSSPPCEVLQYFEGCKIRKIQIGCGDTSTIMGEDSYYFDNGFWFQIHNVLWLIGTSLLYLQ
jgi:hypothetical protein